MKSKKLTDRKKPLNGSQKRKKIGSPKWCNHTLEILKLIWAQKKLADKEWEDCFGKIKKYEVWKVLPTGKPYGSLDKLLEVELKIDGDAITKIQSTRFDELRNAGGTFFGDIGTWVYDEWLKLNQKYFDNKNIPGPIIWGLTPHGKSHGFYTLDSKYKITLHSSLLKPKSRAPWYIDNTQLNKKYASDVLLHEMVHQKIHQTQGDLKGSTHNGPIWVSEVNRIAELIPLSIKACVIKQKRLNGKVVWDKPKEHLTRKQLSTFLYSCRPEGYYDP